MNSTRNVEMKDVMPLRETIQRQTVEQSLELLDNALTYDLLIHIGLIRIITLLIYLCFIRDKR